MHRQWLLEHLEQYTKSNGGESATVDRFIEFINRCSDCFERTLAEGHLTGSAWLVNESGDSVLLTHHRKLNIWVQLGGHADGESNLAKVALKEAEEESGLDELEVIPTIFDIDIHTIPARKTDPEHLHYDVRFVVQNKGDEKYTISEESHDLAWIEIAELAKLTQEESMLRMRDKWIARKG